MAPNAWELDVMISGEVEVSIIDPDTSTLHTYRIKKGNVAFIPMGWWHWIEPLTEEAHLHLFFNNDQFESAEGSDILRLTPPEVFQKAYNVNESQTKQALEPIDETVVIGPPFTNHSKRNVEHHHVKIKINDKDVEFDD